MCRANERSEHDAGPGAAILRVHVFDSVFDKVATCSYFETMREIKTVGIKELKNKLSAYLRDVRSGVRVLVSDRNRVIAELREPLGAYGADATIDPQLADWIEAGIVTPPALEKTPLPKSPVNLPRLDIGAMIDADRKDKTS